MDNATIINLDDPKRVQVLFTHEPTFSLFVRGASNVQILMSMKTHLPVGFEIYGTHITNGEAPENDLG